MGTRHRSRSRSSLLGQLSQQEYREDEDELYLPGGGGIYLTKTKSGKPALARKKKDRLLEDIGIDLLGEACGIPSRREFEQKARRRASMSALNQTLPPPVYPPTSPTSPTTPTTPAPPAPPALIHPTAACGRPRMDYPTRESSDSPVTVIHRPRSTSAYTERIHRCNDRSSSCERQRGRSRAINPSLVSGNYYLSSQQTTPPTITPPPPPAPPPSTWNVQPLDNIAPQVMSNQSAPITPSGQPQVYPSQVTASGTPPNWGLPHTPVGPSPQYLSSSAYPVPQPQIVSVPMLLHQPSPTTSYPGNTSPTDPMPGIRSIRPPPPPPLILSTNKPQEGNKDKTGMDTASVCFSPVQARKFEEHYNATLAASAQVVERDESKCKGEREQTPKAPDLVRRMQHTHTCAACGKKRSKQYQKAHPLKRGQVPKQAYCHQCLQNAALTDSARTDSESTSVVNRTDEDTDDASTVRAVSVNKAHAASDSLNGEKPGYREQWKQNSRRFSLLSNILPGSSAQEKGAKPVQSLPTARKRSTTVPRPTVESGSSNDPASPFKEATRNVHYTFFPSDADAHGHRRVTTPGKVKRSALKKSVRDGSSHTVESPELGLFIDISPVFEQSGNAQDEADVSLQKEGAPKSRSKIPLPILSKNAKSTRKTSPKTVITLSEATSQGGDSDTAYKVKNNSSHRPTPRKDTRRMSGSTYGAKQAAYKTDDSANDYTSSQKSASKNRSYSSQQTRSYEIPRSKQPTREPKPDRHENSGRSRVRRNRANTGVHRQGAWEGHMDTLVENAEDAPQEPTFDLPLTPVDPLYSPDVSILNVTDGYSEDMEQMERAAEKTVEKSAENDLASAGKMFGDFSSPDTSPWTDSNPSPFNMSSHVTRTEISIESYTSSDKRDGAMPMKAFTLDRASETEDITEADDELVKQLEFSSTVDKGQKIAAGAHGRTPSMYSSQPGHRGSQASTPTPKDRSSKKTLRRDRYSSNAPDLASNASSSVVAHTGHSMEDVRADSAYSSVSTVTGRRRRVRRPSRA